MVWGCMGWNGVGMLAEIEGRMNSAQYMAWTALSNLPEVI
jgi:hypothetical protein